MIIGRSHLIVLFMILGAAIVGIFLGMRAAADEVLAQSVLEVPTTIDPRHSVEVIWAPLFVYDQAAVLAALGVTVVPEDRISLNPGFEFGLGGQLVIERALPVDVADANKIMTYHTWSETVSEFLTEQGIELGDHDRVEPNLETVLGVKQMITITRVAVVEITKTESIKYASRTVDDTDRPRGIRVIKQDGILGTRILTYQVTRENGAEVDRKLINSEVTKEPTDEIVAIGTRVVSLGGGRATWYDPPWSGLTAAHNSLPKGTMVDVVNISNGKRVTVKINDRGIQSDAVIDLSVEAFQVLASLRSGVIQVRLEVAG